jgi:hypothetical protein
MFLKEMETKKNREKEREKHVPEVDNDCGDGAEPSVRLELGFSQFCGFNNCQSKKRNELPVHVAKHRDKLFFLVKAPP